jgi:hypothetical protein
VSPLQRSLSVWSCVWLWSCWLGNRQG